MSNSYMYTIQQVILWQIIFKNCSKQLHIA